MNLHQWQIMGRRILLQTLTKKQLKLKYHISDFLNEQQTCKNNTKCISNNNLIHPSSTIAEIINDKILNCMVLAPQIKINKLY